MIEFEFCGVSVFVGFKKITSIPAPPESVPGWLGVPPARPPPKPHPRNFSESKLHSSGNFSTAVFGGIMSIAIKPLCHNGFIVLPK
jgi:hypothetical protein